MKHTPRFIIALSFIVTLTFTCCKYAGDPTPDPTPTPAEYSYKVEHYQQNVSDDEYTLVGSDTESLKGIVNSSTAATAKSYPGFAAKEFNQETIKSDNSTVVKIYYDRKILKVSFDTAGGTSIDDITAKYGTPIVPPANPTKEKSFFLKWNPAFPDTMPANDIILKAVWDKEDFSITLPQGSEDKINLTLTLSDDNNSKVCTASSISDATYKWFVDDQLQSGKTTNVLELKYSEIAKGYHSVLVVVEFEGKTYTKIESFNFIN